MNVSRRAALCTLIIYLCSFSVHSVSATDIVGRAIPEFLLYNSKRGPGLAVLVMRGSKVLHRRGYGFANLQSATPISPQTNFQIASLTKQFTAMAAAILMDEGRFGYREKIGKYFPELSGLVGDLQVQHLIHHTSGLPDYSNLCSSKDIVTNADVIEYVRAKGALNFKPGRKFEYSNTGYILLATLIERVTDESFPAFLNKRILSPVSMTHSAIWHENSGMIPDRAIAYDGFPFFQKNDHNACIYTYGAGRMVSSLDDFTKWIACLESNCIVHPKKMKDIFSPARLNNGATIPYGFGWRLGDYQGEPMHFHEGRWAAFRSYIAHFPRKHLWIVILSNYADISIDQTMQTIVRHYVNEETL